MADDKRLFIAYLADRQNTMFKANDVGLRSEALEYLALVEDQAGCKVTHIVPLHGVSPEEVSQ